MATLGQVTGQLVLRIGDTETELGTVTVDLAHATVDCKGCE